MFHGFRAGGVVDAAAGGGMASTWRWLEATGFAVEHVEEAETADLVGFLERGTGDGAVPAAVIWLSERSVDDAVRTATGRIVDLGHLVVAPSLSLVVLTSCAERSTAVAWRQALGEDLVVVGRCEPLDPTLRRLLTNPVIHHSQDALGSASAPSFPSLR